MTTRSESSPDAPIHPPSDADKQAILTMFAEMMDEASKTMTHEEFKEAAEKSMQALLRGIGREDEAKKVSERQRPSKPHNEGSNPSSPSNTGAESAPQEAGAPIGSVNTVCDMYNPASNAFMCKSASPSEPRRFAFEKWFNAKFLCTIGLNWSPIQGKYLNLENEAFWECWQARVDTAEVNPNQLTAAEPRRDERELAEKLFGRITLISEGYRSRLDSAKTIDEFEKLLAARASAALPEGAEPPQNVEKLAEQLHVWYLEACRNLDSNDYNANAERPYAELTEGQKFLDRYIAGKILAERSPLPSAAEQCTSCPKCGSQLRSVMRRPCDTENHSAHPWHMSALPSPGAQPPSDRQLADKKLTIGYEEEGRWRIEYTMRDGAIISFNNRMVAEQARVQVRGMLAEFRAERTSAVAPGMSKHDLRNCPAMRALESLTPGGSEYIDDIPRCVETVRESHRLVMKALVAEKKRSADRAAAPVEVPPDQPAMELYPLPPEQRRIQQAYHEGFERGVQSLKDHMNVCPGPPIIIERAASGNPSKGKS